MRTCDLCGSTDFKQLPFYYEFEGQKLQGTQCRSCSLMFLHPQPTPEQLERLYGKEYFTDRPNYDRTQQDKKFIDEGKQLDLTKPRPDKFVDYMQAHYPGRKFRYLEVGCGPGYTLKSLQSLGWETHGLEISEHAAEFARQALKLPVVTGNIETTKDFHENQFDLAYMGDVLEHLLSPAATLAKFHRILAPGGLLVLALPATLNLPTVRLGFAAYGMLGKQRKMDIPPYHLYEFTPSTIRRMLAKQGFEVVDLLNPVKPPTHIRLGGSIVEKVGKLAGQYPTYYLNKLTGKFGDRMFVVARNEK
ncbi:class I SAM-dependent methyltransferase [Hymenobacter saemangeumensis]|uniref:Class I SAM-dependent methyltransferase n=1 Tax=Hymenobacter saemangeumensis TaxID=1084522 RepID=A0ABP8I6X6_9BACT